MCYIHLNVFTGESMKKKVVVLGSSGSIGKNTVRVLKMLSDRFEVAGLAVNNSVEILAEQAAELNCRFVVCGNESAAGKLKTLLPDNVRCASGVEAMVEMASSPEVDIVVCAIIGTGGLLPVLAALKAGKRVALASKEVMVMAGALVNSLLDSGHGSIIPVDSEHSAIFQCLNGRDPGELNKLLLTASGGPFRTWSTEMIAKATVKDALAHPVWNMGSKITIDSATLMNKALEIVEAGFLFRLPAEKIEVVLHPQSIVHSMVEFQDKSVIAQLSQPDMRFAIQYALTYPERLDGALPPLDWNTLGKLEFAEADRRKFPSLDMAFAALQIGGTMPAVMNAANEVAVKAFMQNLLTVPQIWACVEEVMQKHKAEKVTELGTVIEADRQARFEAENIIKNLRK